jgi:hypothetical protein
MADSAARIDFDEAAAPATPAAAQVRLYAKADGLLYSKDDAGAETLVSGGAGGGSADLAGKELDYVAITSAVSVTATSEATADTAITGSSVAYDGSTIIEIEVFSPFITPDATNAGRSLSIVLYDGASSIGTLSYIENQVNGRTFYLPFFAARRLTPSNASHTYSIRAHVSAGTGTFGAGVGGSGANMPAFLRITRVSS